MLVSSQFVVLAINWRFKMFKTLKNQFAKMLIIFGGIFILIVFSGIFLGLIFLVKKKLMKYKKIFDYPHPKKTLFLKKKIVLFYNCM